ncbi:MAG: substrate-binding domain-containing protein [Nocardioides sp.]
MVALLLASDNSARWAQADEPAFQARVRALCGNCGYQMRNAQGDPARQRAQLAEVLDAGADVVVLNAVSADSGEALVRRAGEVPGVAYDRFVAGADYYVSFDPSAIGTRVARAVAARVGRGSGVLVVNGAQTDPNGVVIKRSVHRVLARERIRILAEVDPVTWSSAEARDWVAQQLRSRRPGSFDAVLAGNDEQAAGVAEALTDAGVTPDQWPVISGQDASLDALRRIVAGQQTFTVYKSFRREATRAADVALAVLADRPVASVAPDDEPTDVEGVPSFVFTPVVVSVDNLTDTVVRDGLVTPEALCDASIADRCRALGIR